MAPLLGGDLALQLPRSLEKPAPLERRGVLGIFGGVALAADRCAEHGDTAGERPAGPLCEELGHSKLMVLERVKHPLLGRRREPLALIPATPAASTPEGHGVRAPPPALHRAPWRALRLCGLWGASVLFRRTVADEI